MPPLTQGGSNFVDFQEGSGRFARIRYDMKRRGNWMQTYTGQVYWPCDPLPEEVHIEDLAHHLSMLCRFTGACKRFYSIAEHSILVSYKALKNPLCGLLHDGTESYLNDMNRPVKRGPDMSGYRKLEALNWRVIAMRFGLPEVMPADVEAADHEMLFHEQAALMPPQPDGLDWGMGLPRPAVVEPWIIACLSPEQAKAAFLKRFAELT